MRAIDLRTSAGQKVWQACRDRRFGGQDPDRPRRDPLTLKTFGRPVSVREAVTQIIRDVRRDPEAAVLRYSRLLDGWTVTRPQDLKVSSAERRRALRSVPPLLQRAIQLAWRQVLAFHRAQRPGPTVRVKRPGVQVSERWLPLERVGLYVPGGRAPLISTVLMNAAPARAAGVPQLILATPPGPQGRLHPALLYAAELAGVDEVHRMGGALAIAALAVGTPSLAAVQKIVGPGNWFVTEAKRQLIGQVGTDSLAGPSEVLIVADETADPEALLWDLIAQAEHGSGAIGLLLTPSAVLLRGLSACARRLSLSEARSLSSIVLVKVQDLGQAIGLAEEYAPEHLSLQVRDPQRWLGRVRRAGAVFLGAATPQALGDYLAGPNHVLPTNGTAAWASPLSTRDFLRTSSVIAYTAAGVRREGPAAIAIAEAEGLSGHARAIRLRLARSARP